MALIVEDGTVVAGAEVYADLDYINSYLAGKGYTSWNPLSEFDQESAARRAMSFIDGFDFLGSRSSDTQTLEFPRVEIYYPSGIEMLGIIPTELKNAFCEATYVESVSAGSLFPSTSDLSLKRRKVGSIEREFFKTTAGVNSQQPIILNLLKRFIYSGRRVSRC